MEVKGYPTLIFFPGKNENVAGPTEGRKYQGQRTLEDLTTFALKDGWKTVGQESMIPLNLKGIQSWARWFAQQKMMVQRDINMAWEQYGLFAYIPAPWHYTLVTLICMIPFVLICSLLCCFIDEDEPPPGPKVKPDHASAAGGKKPATSNQKPEKLE